MGKSNIVLKLLMVILIVVIALIASKLIVQNPEKGITYSLTLLSNNYMELYQGESFVDPGYICIDSNNNNCNDLVTVTNPVNTNITGTYNILYQLSSKKNTIVKEIQRVVNVKEDPLKNINIELTNGNYLCAFVNEPFIDPGYTIVDNNNNPISLTASIEGYVDTNKIGNYQLSYTIIKDGISKSVVRDVKVIDINLQAKLSNYNYTNQNIYEQLSVSFDDFLYIETPDGNKKYQSSINYLISDNGEYTFKIYNRFNTYKEYEVTVNNIDKVLPNGTCTLKGQDIIASASDNNGNVNYSYSMDGKNNYGNYTTNNTFKINYFPSLAFMKIKDTAGNTNEILCQNELVIGPGYIPYEYTDSLGYNCVYPYTCFKQLDYNDSYQASGDGVGIIRNTGCQPTSLTVILSGFNIRDNYNKFYNPSTFVNNYLYKDGDITGYSNQFRIDQTIKDFSLKSGGTYSFNSNIDILKEHLRNGYPAILLVRSGCYTNGAHYLNILAINNKDEVFVSDPYSRTKTSFKDCIDNTWIPLTYFANNGGAASFTLIGK